MFCLSTAFCTGPSHNSMGWVSTVIIDPRDSQSKHDDQDAVVL